jgi:tetratricopeptide (TPR) repeat protein
MRRFATLALAASALFLALSGAWAQNAPTSAKPAPSAAIAEALKPYAAASKDCRAVLEKATTLSSQGQWKSAFRAIDDFDKANADPYALAMKVSLVLRGAVRSDMHRSFGLTDLKEGQTLDTLRNGEGDYEPIAFDPPALAAAQAAKGISVPGILSKELGDYYYDVLGRYSGQWAISDDGILAKAVENYEKAYKAGVYDEESLLNHADSLVRSNRGDDSEAIYKKALALDPKSANALYGYATSLYFRDKKADAFPVIDKAIEAYGKDSSRINAIALGARIATELGDDAKAETYFAIVEKEFPNNPTAGILRHMIAVENAKKEAAAAAADSLVSQFGSNPSVVRTLISAWYASGDAPSARDFLQRNIAKSGDDLTIATLDFYLAVLLTQDSPTDADKAAALIALDEAEPRFKAALGPENDVFTVIDQMRAALQPAKEPAADAGGK